MLYVFKDIVIVLKGIDFCFVFRGFFMLDVKTFI